MKNRYIIIISLFIIFFAASMHAENIGARQIKETADSLYCSHDYADALSYYIKGMDKANKEKDMETYMSCMGSIANIYANYGDKYGGLRFLEKGYKEALDADNKNMQGLFLINLVSAYCRVNDVENAKKYLVLLKKTPTEKDIDVWKYYIIYNEARIKNVENDFYGALQKHKEALAFARNNNLGMEKIMFQENEIALLYLKLNDYKNALSWGDVCMQKAIKEKHLDLLANAYKVLYMSYRGLSDSINEARYYNLYNSVKDSVFNVENFYSLKHKLKEYEDRQVADDMNALRTRSIAIVSVVVLIAALSVGFVVKRVKKSKRRTKETKGGNDSILIEEGQIKDIFEKIERTMGDKELISNPNFSLNLLAEEIKSNTKYVSWVINNKYQMNFNSLLNERRIREACKMLDDEACRNYTIQYIYEAVGYKNATSFITAFKKIVGMTPAEYRKRGKTE